MQANTAEVQSAAGVPPVSDNEILAQYGWVAKSLANRNSGGDERVQEELEQIGMAALVEVGRKWRPGKQALSSFAYPRVRGAILDFLREEREHAGLTSLDEPSPASDGEIPLRENIASEDENPEEALLRKEREFLIGHALEALPTRERDILTMKFYEDADDETIAETLGVHRTTAMRNIRSALDSLKTKLLELEAI